MGTGEPSGLCLNVQPRGASTSSLWSHGAGRDHSPDGGRLCHDTGRSPEAGDSQSGSATPASYVCEGHGVGESAGESGQATAGAAGEESTPALLVARGDGAAAGRRR